MKHWYVTVEGEGTVGELKLLTEQFVDVLEENNLSVKRCAIDVTEQNVIVGFEPIEQYKPEVYELDPTTGDVKNITAAVTRVGILQGETAAVQPKIEKTDGTGHDFGGK